MNDALMYLSSKLREQMKQIEEDMVLGRAKDFGEYKFAAGIYRGLITANGLVAETLEKMEQDDDD